MALSCALRLLHRHLRPSNALLSSLPGRDHGVLNNKKIAAKWKEKKKVREGCSLPGSSWEERLANAVTPLWRLPYQEQLQVKYESQRKNLQTLTSRLEELGIDAQKPDGLCCPLRPVVPSPVINGYRNKSTFSVNQGPDGNPKTVGLYVGTGRARNIVCVKANHVENIPPKHKEVAQWYEEYIRCSPLDPCLLFHEGGHWRELVVRTTSRGHTMAIITFHPQELGQEALATQKALLKEFFTCGPGAVCALTSLYFQESTMTRCSHEQSPFQLLHGEPHIFEEVLGLKFRISPDAFFQVNTGGAEVLYQTVRELSQAGGDTVLLDICCGTGTIGLSLAHQVSKIIGIEVVEKAVEDARWNAAFNGISNCEFHSGKAEAVLPQLLSSWEDSQALVAVVNPSRAGLRSQNYLGEKEPLRVYDATFQLKQEDSNSIFVISPEAPEDIKQIPAYLLFPRVNNPNPHTLLEHAMRLPSVLVDSDGLAPVCTGKSQTGAGAWMQFHNRVEDYRVVRAIRNCKSIRRLLYISCKPEGEAMRNFLELCCPPNPGKKLAGEPFAPTLAIPFDMFPHTLHCELVLLFTR